MTIALKQRISQLLSSILFNSAFSGFITGSIYQGKFKYLPCPGFNCHSCPSALLACPIGAIQLFVSFGAYHVSFYLLGFLGSIGAVGGRIVCGWACPFGLMQDMLYRIRLPKIKVPEIMRKMKFFILFFVVLGVAYYTKEPWFCKFCPMGTLEAGIPLVSMNADLLQLTGWLFCLKISILAGFAVWMTVSKRPFCQTVCPLGAIYSFFNKISFLRLKVNKKKCIKCNLCADVCPVDIKIYQEGGGSANCIRCFRCTKCPAEAIKITFNTTLQH